MKTSENINEIAAALSKAQGEMIPAAKDASNPFFKSKYSDLKSVSDVIKEPFQRNNLTVVQDVTTLEKGVSVSTMVMHASGQWIQFSPMTLPISKNDIQGFGSGISYARRYALCSSLCIVSSEDQSLDNDGNDHVEQPTKMVEVKPKEVVPGDQMALLERTLKLCPEEYQERFLDDVLKFYGQRKVSSIPAKNFAIHLKRVQEKLKSLEAPIAV